jgi:hypothetical protein
MGSVECVVLVSRTLRSIAKLYTLWFYNFLPIRCIDSTQSRLLSRVFMTDITVVNTVDWGVIEFAIITLRLPCVYKTQELATSPGPEPDQSSPHLTPKCIEVECKFLKAYGGMQVDPRIHNIDIR